MEFGDGIRHPLLQTAIGVGEATIRQACGREPKLEILVDLERFKDGREAFRIILRGPESAAGFFMLMRNYFDSGALRRAAENAWLRRVRSDRPARSPFFDASSN